ncbi:MAG: 1-acyl-sn-glycerol-3-phosphate acyltransferase [Deltaproteobacteria bacterium]|nr:1-acyl-sn-glycerol-3-phosphate acyltransferase [Deltaproteobacteria bacterium]MBW2390841.1 1-acyl-sn-glycerol-3-phosphate acyltransferase [Deltaproteobacteria bacterium]MBW2725747.1 1-acyl-sn-glycerol-3-phosphate acyltransferase [Deltaproteobacteria bacterium]
MLDIPRLKRIPLSRYPLAQKVVGYLGLWPNYRLPPRVEIELQGLERLPEGSVIYAMNHTDRYNYFPFQYQMWRSIDRFTATWVKGKYYENPLLGKFMELTNNLPTVSRGYLITRDFVSVMKRNPDEDEYTALRKWVDATASGSGGEAPEFPAEISKSLLTEPRDVLGYAFDPARESYPEYINSIFRVMMKLFVDLNQRALDLGLDLLIFPQGTRSIRLIRGHIGLAEMALRFQATVVPVGCSGSDLVYPGASPFGKGGRIVYRFGEPILHKEMERFHLASEFEPFNPIDEAREREKLQGYVDVVMDRINELVDPQYQFGDGDAPLESRSRRFV